MKLKKLFKNLWRLRKDRKDYRIKWCVKYYLDDWYYVFCLLPTITITPWIYRYPGSSIVNIHWLNFGIDFCKWINVNGEEKMACDED